MRSTWPAALLALALLTGCGSSSSGSPQAGPPAPAATSGSAAGKTSDSVQCPANSVVGDGLGITVTGTDAPAPFGKSTIACSYNGTKANGESTSVTLRVQTDASHGDYADFKDKTAAQHYVVADRSGVGDEAFTYAVTNTSDPLNALVARKGRLFVYVASQTSFDQLVVLFNKLASQ
jgi:hypothetical protein